MKNWFTSLFTGPVDSVDEVLDSFLDIKERLLSIHSQKLEEGDEARDLSAQYAKIAFAADQEAARAARVADRVALLVE